MPRVSLRAKRIRTMQKVMVERNHHHIIRHHAGINDAMEDCIDLMLTRRLKRLELERHL